MPMNTTGLAKGVVGQLFFNDTATQQKIISVALLQFIGLRLALQQVGKWHSCSTILQKGCEI